MRMMLSKAKYKVFVQRSDEDFLLEVSAENRTSEKFLADLSDNFICPEVEETVRGILGLDLIVSNRPC